jgi:Putative transposase
MRRAARSCRVWWCDTGALRLIGRCAPLHDPQQWHRWIAQLRAKQWVAYAKRPFGGPEQALDFLGRYTHRIALSNERLVAVEQKKRSPITTPCPADIR